MLGPWVRVPAGSLKTLIRSGSFFIAYIYLLHSVKLNKYHIGSCTNLDRRLCEHNIGHSKFISLGVSWIVVYTEEYEILRDANQREQQIKQKKSRKYIEDLIGKG